MADLPGRGWAVWNLRVSPGRRRAPLYTRFVDVYDAVERLVTLVERGDQRGIYDRPLRVT